MLGTDMLQGLSAWEQLFPAPSQSPHVISSFVSLPLHSHNAEPTYKLMYILHL